MDQDIDDRIPMAFAGSKVGTCQSEIGSLQCEFARAVLLPEEWVSQTTELLRLTHTIAHGIGQILQRQGLLVRDAEQSYLARDPSEEGAEDSMNLMQRRVITYRIAVGPDQGRKVLTLSCSPEQLSQRTNNKPRSRRPHSRNAWNCGAQSAEQQFDPLGRSNTGQVLAETCREGVREIPQVRSPGIWRTGTVRT